jgi:chromosome segregation ATPase
MIRDWLKSKTGLPAEQAEQADAEPGAELAELRASVARLQEELQEATETIGQLEGDLSRERQRGAEARRERDTAREKIGHLLIKMEASGDRAVLCPPVPRTDRQELALARARADALGVRVQQLQEANMRAGCMHEIPVQEPVSGV